VVDAAPSTSKTEVPAAIVLAKQRKKSDPGSR